MVYEVPKSRASIAQNRFAFKFAGSSKKYDVPLMKYIKPALAMKLERLSDAEVVVALFEEYFPGQNLFEKFEDSEQFEAFMLAWQEASGIELGESEASLAS
jgi:hypothetical protein